MACTQKENITLSKSMALLASSHEDFVKTRFNLLVAKAEQTSQKSEVELLKPLVNNYAVIFRECLIDKGKMQAIIKMPFKSQENEAFKEFASKIIKTDTKLQRLWGSNNLSGFIALVESLLMKYTGEEKDK